MVKEKSADPELVRQGGDHISWSYGKGAFLVRMLRSRVDILASCRHYFSAPSCILCHQSKFTCITKSKNPHALERILQSKEEEAGACFS